MLISAQRDHQLRRLRVGLLVWLVLPFLVGIFVVVVCYFGCLIWCARVGEGWGVLREFGSEVDGGKFLEFCCGSLLDGISPAEAWIPMVEFEELDCSC